MRGVIAFGGLFRAGAELPRVDSTITGNFFQAGRRVGPAQWADIFCSRQQLTGHSPIEPRNRARIAGRTNSLGEVDLVEIGDFQFGSGRPLRSIGDGRCALVIKIEFGHPPA